VSPTRAQAMLALFSQLDIIDTREEPVQAVLSPKADAWTWGLEVRRMYGTELLAPYRGDRRQAIKEALIEGADTWSMLDDDSHAPRPTPMPSDLHAVYPPPPTGEALAAAWAPAVTAATIPAVPEGTELTWDTAPDVARSNAAADDDDDEPERPAIIGATPEEVRRRIDAARAGGLATGVPEPASTETDDLDDLPF
jgi:hypothetical protein